MELLRATDVEIKYKTDELLINLHYPIFDYGEPCGTGKKGKQTTATARLNLFYADAAKKYERYLERLTSHGKQALFKNTRQLPCGSMKWYLSYLDKHVASVIVEVLLFDGENKASARFFQNWLLPHALPLDADSVIKTDKASRRYYITEICDKIAASEGGFRYYPNAQKIAARQFDAKRFYYTPNGIAFYYKSGVLSDGDQWPAFVLPYSRVLKTVL